MALSFALLIPAYCPNFLTLLSLAITEIIKTSILLDKSVAGSLSGKTIFVGLSKRSVREITVEREMRVE
jgi:hypothetical protein